MATFANGGVSFGPYSVLVQIGQGGMSQIFRARRKGWTTDCALKVLKDDLLEDVIARDLFLTEADLCMMLKHPNLVSTYDAGEIDGRAYIAMELFEIGTLADLIEKLAREGVGIPGDLALLIVAQLLDGLHALHTAVGQSGRPLGVVHRDVTPHNIFFSPDGRVALGDFGAAHVQAHGSPSAIIPGKAAYIAPEALLAGELDARARSVRCRRHPLRTPGGRATV